MKQLISVFLFGFFLFMGVYSQETATEVPDTIFMLGGKKIYAKILGVTSSKVTFMETGDTEVKSEERKQIQKIIYNNGRKEIFNKPIFEMVQEGDYRTVILTDDPSEVEGLTKKGKVEAKSSSSSRNKKSAKRSVEIRIQKKAAGLGAQIVLITKKESIGGYGEIPSYTYEGIAYGFDW